MDLRYPEMQNDLKTLVNQHQGLGEHFTRVAELTNLLQPHKENDHPTYTFNNTDLPLVAKCPFEEGQYFKSMPLDHLQLSITNHSLPLVVKC